MISSVPLTAAPAPSSLKRRPISSTPGCVTGARRGRAEHAGYGTAGYQVEPDGEEPDSERDADQAHQGFPYGRAGSAGVGAAGAVTGAGHGAVECLPGRRRVVSGGHARRILPMSA